ncbi:MAG: DNA starvation/stationary phase protection protein [Flavobacteriales bacterium]|nr:DNA starvation/stationary phase protection protein [Flavobacteriales bacterium]
MTQNKIGLDAEKCKRIVAQLNRLLADYQIHYQNLRGFHWNIRGNGFFTLHPLFEQYYNEAAERVDQIAERIITLGGTPSHTFQDYLDNTSLLVYQNVSDASRIATDILADIGRLIKSQRDIILLSSDADDEVTVDIMIGYNTSDEKKIWMLGAFLNQ